MKNKLCALALAAITAGCATPQASIGTTRPTASNVPAYYCARDRLNANGALLECNWQATIDEACEDLLCICGHRDACREVSDRPCPRRGGASPISTGQLRKVIDSFPSGATFERT